MKDNFFYEIPERVANKDTFNLLCEMSREAEIVLEKEQLDFERYVCEQLNNGSHEPVYEMKQTYKRKENIETALYKYRMCGIRMEQYLAGSPQVTINGDFSECEEIYDRRYDKVDHDKYKTNLISERQWNEIKKYEKNFN